MSAPKQITVESVLRRIERRCKNALAYQNGDVAVQDWARGHRCAGDYIMVTCKAIRAELRKQCKAHNRFKIGASVSTMKEAQELRDSFKRLIREIQIDAVMGEPRKEEQVTQ